MEPIEPNRLSTPGEREARARIEAVFAAVDRLSADDLNEAAVPALDLEDREIRLAALERHADAAGRGRLLDGARDRLSDALLRRFADRFAFAYGTRASGVARVEDQAAIITALRDLVAVAATRDLIEATEADALSAPGLRVLGPAWDATPLDPAGIPTALHDSGDAARGAPTADDWAEAETGTTAIVPTARSSGTRDPRALVVLALSVGGVLAIVAMRTDRSQVVVGALLGGAAILVVWAILAWRRR
jgi:hypothetical protein